MIFVIPIILGGAAAIAGVAGIAKGIEGHNNFQEAEKIGKSAQARYERATKRLKSDWQSTNRIAQIYGQLQVRVAYRIVGRFVDFIQRSGQKASQSEVKFLEELGLSVQELQACRAIAFNFEKIPNSLNAAAGAGIIAGTGAVTMAQTVGSVAVPQFFGLFVKQVAVSELGLSGVAMYFGAGNAVLGSAVLGGIALGPALAVGGFHLAGYSEQALTKAKKYEAEVNIRIAELETARSYLAPVEQRIREMGKLVYALECQASLCLNDLDTQPFDHARDINKFQRVALIVCALVEIMKTPVLLEGTENLNPETVKLWAKYKKLGKF